MNPKANHGLFGAIVEALSESVAPTASAESRTMLMHNKVQHHLKRYYGHLKITDAYREMGDEDKANEHLQLASDNHSEAVAHHKELTQHSVVDHFDAYKRAARQESGWVEK